LQRLKLKTGWSIKTKNHVFDLPAQADYVDRIVSKGAVTA